MSGRPKPSRTWMRHDLRIFGLAFLAGLPGCAISLILLWDGNTTSVLRWTLAALMVLCWLGFAWMARNAVVRPLQTLSNVLAALREGDFSLRARGGMPDDPLGAVILEVNALGETLKAQRLGAVEATALLRTVMTEIDVAVFTFDRNRRLRLVNRSGERLLGATAEEILGQTAAELQLQDCLEGEAKRTLQKTFSGGPGRWGLSRTDFWQEGEVHELLVLSDLSRALREEERNAWQRLLRVLGHELNNSLAPINSIADSLGKIVARTPLPEDWREDVQGGLAVIASRAEALGRFMQAYSRLARLPQPKLRPVEVGPWIRRVTGLETRLKVELSPGPEVTVQADSDQLDQLLINLIRNGVEASMETLGKVRVGWETKSNALEVRVLDEGPGVSNDSNLFVPFFTTKPGGSGVGLVLCRQIAEAHGGTLQLRNRQDARGCEALLQLPLP